MPDTIAALDDRAVLAVEGLEARGFLQRLVTNDVDTLDVGQARYAALLTPQGKIITDFIIIAQADGGLLLDAPAATAADLVRRLTLYKLRAKVTVTDRSAALGVIAYDAAPPPAPLEASYADPRAPGLWRRAIVARGAFGDPEGVGRRGYREHRIRAGIPEGGSDFTYGDVFPHDANLDHLNGLDFGKGCYVGQEVVSRVQHRGTARKRIVPATFDGDPPPQGADITADGVPIGTMGSSIGGLGLALVRLDRAGEAAGLPMAAGTHLRLAPPAWVRAPSGSAA